MKPTLILYYDKECPFCNRYAAYLTLKKSYRLHLKNARVSLDEIGTNCPDMDINEGMILHAETRCLQGTDALAYLDHLLLRHSFFGKIHRVWSLSPWLTIPLYSVLKLLRRSVLFLMGKKSDIR